MIHAFPTPFNITRPLLPDIKEMNHMVDLIWKSNQLSNNGNMVKQLEKKLAEFLDVNHISLFANGTIALQLACKTLRLSGEVITTPFTFSSTVHSLAWNNIKPVFCDIEEDTFNIDPKHIERLITENTTGILPVHVFGNPCNVEAIQKIAARHNLKVLYDAAHAFGVKNHNTPIATYGDASMFSLHATKIFHTLEGGALAFNKLNLKERAHALKNFGEQTNGNITEPGTNGKLNEVQAAVGLLLLKEVKNEILKRKYITKRYKEFLKDIPGLILTKDLEGVSHNYQYFPIRIDHTEFGLTRNTLHDELKKYNIFTRKYFYPLCSNFQCYENLPSADKSNLPIANKIADSILVLPLHGRMTNSDVEKICLIISHIQKHSLL